MGNEKAGVVLFHPGPPTIGEALEIGRGRQMLTRRLLCETRPREALGPQVPPPTALVGRRVAPHARRQLDAGELGCACPGEEMSSGVGLAAGAAGDRAIERLPVGHRLRRRVPEHGAVVRVTTRDEAVWLADASHLGHGGNRIGEVLEDLVGMYDVERSVVEGEPVDVAHLTRDVRLLARLAERSGLLHDAGVRVDADHRTVGHSPGESDRNRPRPTSDIEHLGIGPEVGQEVRGRVLHSALAVRAEHGFVMAMEISMFRGACLHGPMFERPAWISKEDSKAADIRSFMADTELLRTFLAIYRAGSLTDAAHHRGISQPAVSQHLAALERASGARLFVRGPAGVTPTEHARELYAQVTEPLDALEAVIAGLRGKETLSGSAPVRVGSSPEFFSAEVLPRLVGSEISVSAVFGTDAELLALLDHAEIDLAVTSSSPARRSMQAVQIGAKRFSLVCARQVAPSPSLRSLEELAAWLRGQPWASYSLELPITRRFWQTVLGRPFSARPRLVVPDLRAVLRAVELGIGVSLLPTFVCADPLAEGRVVEPFPVADLVEEEPWFACTRVGDARRPAVRALLDELAVAD